MARSGHVAQSFILLGLETKGGHWAASLGNILQCLINLVVIFSPLIPSENLLCFNPCLLCPCCASVRQRLPLSSQSLLVRVGRWLLGSPQASSSSSRTNPASPHTPSWWSPLCSLQFVNIVLDSGAPKLGAAFRQFITSAKESGTSPPSINWLLVWPKSDRYSGRTNLSCSVLGFVWNGC